MVNYLITNKKNYIVDENEMKTKRILIKNLKISLSLIFNWKNLAKTRSNYQLFEPMRKTVIKRNDNYQLVRGIDDVELEDVDEVVATNARRRHAAADLVDDLVLGVFYQKTRTNPKWAEKEKASESQSQLN